MNKKNQEIKQKGGKNKLILNKKYHKLNENSKKDFQCIDEKNQDLVSV